MLGFIFGFNARIGRLQYLFATLALAVVMTVVAYGLAVSVWQRLPPGADPSIEDLMTWPVMAAIAGFAGATFALQCMRVRDIGWDPVCVMPAWIADVIVDA